MKVLVIVTLFAFVAVQISQSAPVPDDAVNPDAEKVDKVDKKDEPAEAAPAAPTDAAAPAVTAETKSESSSSDTSAKVAETPAPAEEKKE